MDSERKRAALGASVTNSVDGKTTTMTTDENWTLRAIAEEPICSFQGVQLGLLGSGWFSERDMKNPPTTRVIISRALSAKDNVFS